MNLDLIYVLPSQTLVSWQHTLERTLAPTLEHMSLYCLTLEEGTPLQDRIFRGHLSAPNSDLAADK